MEKKTFVYTAGSRLSAARAAYRGGTANSLVNTVCRTCYLPSMKNLRLRAVAVCLEPHGPAADLHLSHLSAWMGKPLWGRAFQASLSQRKAMMTICFGPVLFLGSPLPPAHPICCCPSKSGCTATSKLESQQTAEGLAGSHGRGSYR